MTDFLKKLEVACASHRSLLCVGLDPDPELMPSFLSTGSGQALGTVEGLKDVFQFNRAIVDATADLVCAYKPNMAFYEALGLEGLTALMRTVEYIRKAAADVLIIGDGKKGDIGPSMAAYYRAMFDVWDVDAMTVSAYLGMSAALPFPYEGKGVFVLCRTSNEGAGDFQDIMAPFDGEERPLYQHVALKCRQWNTAGNVGLVIGATYPQELKALRELCPDMAFLIPGVGAQGGSLEAAVRWGTDRKGRLAIINSSRQVIYASTGRDFAEAARREALRLREAISAVLEEEGVGWS